MPPPRALLVESSPELAARCTRLLAEQGFAVVLARQAAAVLPMLREERPDVVLLDVVLPDEDGFAVCRRLRAVSDVPVLLLTVRDEESDRVVGMSVGADACLTKPFSNSSFVSRVQALAHRHAGPRDARNAGRLFVDPLVREARLDGRAVPLTRSEFDLLLVLAANPGRVFSRRELRQHLWGDAAGDHLLDVHLGALREKIGESATVQRHLRTVPGVGYRFDPV